MSTTTNNLIIISHAHREGKFRGPTDVMIENLLELKVSFFLIEHDLCLRGDTLLVKYEEDGTRKIVKTVQRKETSIFRRYYEDCRLSFLLSRDIYFSSGTAQLLVAVNPLNALAGLFIRKKGFCEKLLFISADYTKKRFGNFLLDWVYCFLDKYVSLHADMTGSVSTRIQKIRKDFGLSDKKNYFFPNTPPKSVFQKKCTQDGKSSEKKLILISVGSLSQQLSYYTMFDAIKELRKDYPDIVLKIIGGGEKEDEYKKYVAKNFLQDNVVFLGRLPHSTVMENMSDASIGLALYSGKWNFNYFGDSMKVREYVGFGLPVITTDTHSTVDDIRFFKAGIIVEDTTESLIRAIKHILFSGEYASYSERAMRMFREYETVYKDFFEKNIRLSNMK